MKKVVQAIKDKVAYEKESWRLAGEDLECIYGPKGAGKKKGGKR